MSPAVSTQLHIAAGSSGPRFTMAPPCLLLSLCFLLGRKPDLPCHQTSGPSSVAFPVQSEHFRLTKMREACLWTSLCRDSDTTSRCHSKMTAPASGQLDTDAGSLVPEEGWLLCPEANEWSQPLALLMSDYSALACPVLAHSSPSYEIQSGGGWGRSPLSLLITCCRLPHVC